VDITVWIHIRVLYSVPLAFLSVFVPVPCCFYRYGSVNLIASMSRSIDLTRGDWGLRKRHKDRHRESWGQMGLTFLMRDAGDPRHLQAHLFIQHVWESRVICG
jgi:hypothetical protein